MKKLSIEQVLAYLPYGVNADLIRKGKFESRNVNLKQCGLDYNSSIEEWYFTRLGVTFGMNHIKLHLRQLSDLTKEIEVNGEKFVPMDMFYEMYGGGNSSKSQFKKDYYDNIIYTPYKSLSYETVQKLIEWHFNIFSLPENLWININTL